MPNREYYDFIKDYAKKHKVSYMCALPDASAEWRKKHPKPVKKKMVKKKVVKKVVKKAVAKGDSFMQKLQRILGKENRELTKKDLLKLVNLYEDAYYHAFQNLRIIVNEELLKDEYNETRERDDDDDEGGYDDYDDDDDFDITEFDIRIYEGDHTVEELFRMDPYYDRVSFIFNSDTEGYPVLKEYFKETNDNFDLDVLEKRFYNLVKDSVKLEKLVNTYKK